ncbi:MAG: hypothetical protein IK093_08180 [Ruminiclostridium sp.]|nr:hypothetical protein [Ruminiclostridium sp.]
MAVTYRNIIDFIADYCLAVLDAQDRLEKGIIPSSSKMDFFLWDFYDEQYIEFENTEGSYTRLAIMEILDEYAVQSYNEIGGNRTEREIMADCVCVLMPKNIVFAGTLGGTLMEIALFDDFGWLVFFYGQIHNRDFSQPTINLINKSAVKNGLRLDWRDPILEIYENAG